MSIGNQIRNLGKKVISTSSPDIKEANVIGFGSSSGKYKIKFRNGAVANEVIGQVGLSVGQSVVVAKYPGKINRYSIISVGYQSTGVIKEVEV